MEKIITANASHLCQSSMNWSEKSNLKTQTHLFGHLNFWKNSLRFQRSEYCTWQIAVLTKQSVKNYLETKIYSSSTEAKAPVLRYTSVIAFWALSDSWWELQKHKTEIKMHIPKHNIIYLWKENEKNSRK